MAQPTRPHSDNGDLTAAEKKAVDSVQHHAQQGGAEDGLAAYRTAYTEFAKTHSPQEAQQFVRETMATFKSQHLSPELAAAFGFAQEHGKGMDDRLHSATVDALTQSRNPLDAALAQELKGNLNRWNSEKTDGGILNTGINAKPTDGVKKQDLFNEMAPFDQAQFDGRHHPFNSDLNRSQDEQRDDSTRNVINIQLLKNGLFDKVFADTGRQHTGKPDEDMLSGEDFQNYLKKHGSTISPQDRGALNFLLQHWNTNAVASLEPSNQMSEFVGLSKRSIRDGIDKMASPNDIAQDVGPSLLEGGNNSLFAQVARFRGQDPTRAVLSPSDFESFREQNHDQIGPNELIAIHRALLAFQNNNMYNLTVGGAGSDERTVSEESIRKGIQSTKPISYPFQ